MKHLILLGALIIFLASCGEPAAPANPLAGTWKIDAEKTIAWLKTAVKDEKELQREIDWVKKKQTVIIFKDTTYQFLLKPESPKTDVPFDMKDTGNNTWKVGSKSRPESAKTFGLLDNGQTMYMEQDVNGEPSRDYYTKQ